MESILADCHKPSGSNPDEVFGRDRGLRRKAPLPLPSLSSPDSVLRAEQINGKLVRQFIVVRSYPYGRLMHFELTRHMAADGPVAYIKRTLFVLNQKGAEFLYAVLDNLLKAGLQQAGWYEH